MGQIVVEIDEQGNIKSQTVGFKGGICMTIGNKFRGMLKKLGVEAENEKIVHTPEMHESPQSNKKIAQ